MWRQLQSFMQTVDERFPPIVVDVSLAAAAAALITFIVRVVPI
jgi:hypothetical protein